MRVQWLGRTALLLVCCFYTHALRAQQGSASCTPNRAVPSDVTLKLGLKDGQAVYHEGEIIPLELSFSAGKENKYHLDDRTSDHSGRHHADSFCLDPDARDPLEDYFESGVWSVFDIGGLGGWHALGRVPYVVSLELSEFRSLPPGNYTLRVVSHRVLKVENGVIRQEAVASNPVAFQVVAANPQWQAKQLAGALALLDADHKKLTQTEYEQTKHAERVLRFLGSEATTRELARRFWSHDQQWFRPNIHTPGSACPTYVEHEYQLSVDLSNFEFGLIGSPHRELAIQELEVAIHDPQRPATPAMVQTLAMLEIMSNPKYEIPPYGGSANEEWRRQWEAQRQVRADAYEDLVAKFSKEIQ